MMNKSNTIVVGYSQILEDGSDETRAPFLSSWTNSAMIKPDTSYKIKSYIKRLDFSEEVGSYSFAMHGFEISTYIVQADERVSGVLHRLAKEVSTACDRLFNDVGSIRPRDVVWPHAKAAFWRPLRLRYGLGRAVTIPGLTLMDPIDISFDDTFPTGGDRLGITPEDLQAMAHRDMVTSITPSTVMLDMLKLCNLPI